jgi:hypothetical protein
MSPSLKNSWLYEPGSFLVAEELSQKPSEHRVFFRAFRPTDEIAIRRISLPFDFDMPFKQRLMVSAQSKLFMCRNVPCSIFEAPIFVGYLSPIFIAVSSSRP